MTTNEAAERLKAAIARPYFHGGPDLLDLVDAALAAERRATVERLAARVGQLARFGELRSLVSIADVLAILDEEEAR